jgi:hypothetical protein
MKSTSNNIRYLAIHPTTYGLGYALFEGAFRLLDWGTYRAKRDKNQNCFLFLGVLIRRYEPHVVLFEDRGPRERQRSERIRHFIRAATIYFRRYGITAKRVSRRRMQTFFEGQGATTKQEIAIRITELFPELSQDLPPKRKAWMPEHPRMGTFEALAIALTYFGTRDSNSKNP